MSFFIIGWLDHGSTRVFYQVKRFNFFFIFSQTQSRLKVSRVTKRSSLRVTLSGQRGFYNYDYYIIIIIIHFNT